MIERRPLGESGLEVSALALGTWAMGGATESWGPVDDRESIDAIHCALGVGINLIDTAPVYGLGHSEEVVGKALRGRRSEVILASKCGLLLPRGSNQPPRRCLSTASILNECRESLRRLQTDYIDLYQFHWPDRETPIEESMGAMDQLLREGKIRAIGLSNFGCAETATARHFGPIHAVQPPFSIIQARAVEDLIPYCQEHRIAVLPYSPLCKGLLAGRINAETPRTGIRERDPEFLGTRFRRNLDVVSVLQAMALRYGKTTAQITLNWTAHYPGVTSPIFGAKRPSQVTENAGALGWALSDEDRTTIDALARED